MEELFERINSLTESLNQVSPNSPQLVHVSRLKEDIERDVFTVVTVGEFKTGKSTFINALLGERLLPTNVTPMTATVHLLYESEDEDIQVVKASGEKEFLPRTKTSLDQFTADSDFDPRDVQYVKVPHSASILQNRVVLVDTPGVNDLNEHRVEVTHQFVPRADAVLFMVDIMAPLKAAEIEFLQDHVLKNGSDHLLFIANFIDQLDEEEEIEETLDFINRRLGKLTGRSQHTILPVSAFEALQSVDRQDQELYQYSGMPEVLAEIETLIEKGTKQVEKQLRFSKRLRKIEQTLVEELSSQEQVMASTQDALSTELAEMDAWFHQEEERRKQLEYYMDERMNEVKYIVFKSIDHFKEKLTRSIMDDIEAHEGGGIKQFVEKKINRKVKQELTRWVEEYSPSIERLFQKLTDEICAGLNQSFQTTTVMKAGRNSVNYENDSSMNSPVGGNVQIQSGAIIGTASAIALTLGATVLFPIVALVGQPWLSSKLKERQWEKAKPQVKGVVLDYIDEVFIDFKKHMNQFLTEQADDIQRQALVEFERLMEHYQLMLQEEIGKKQREYSQQDGRVQKVKYLKSSLVEVKEEEGELV